MGGGIKYIKTTFKIIKIKKKKRNKTLTIYSFAFLTVVFHLKSVKQINRHL